MFFTSQKSPTFLLLLDYDGTLAPFTPNRFEAWPYEGITERLEELLKIKRIRVVIISGRNVADLQKLLVLCYQPEMWGSHGLERFSNGTYSHFELNEKQQQELNAAKKSV
ncbi:MAG: hypothetical protein HWD61_15220 [Parachlamydiaceae bacterium]|nr:MAG: hypothetical protein HWD61_15220 [Parachlamydiaceae bacterium]